MQNYNFGALINNSCISLYQEAIAPSEGSLRGLYSCSLQYHDHPLKGRKAPGLSSSCGGRGVRLQKLLRDFLPILKNLEENHKRYLCTNYVQRSAKRYANLAKQDPGKGRQNW